jgi:hypothetical protein
MTFFRVRWRLSQAATRNLTRHGLGLSMSGRIYLSLLLTRAAVRVVRDRRVDQLETAEESLRRLLLEASGGVSDTETGPGLEVS